MEKQTTFQINITQRRRRLANVRVTVKPDITECDGVAWGNESAVPLALGLLLYAAHSFTPEGSIRAALELAIEAYDPTSKVASDPPRTFTARQTPAFDGDIPF